MLNERILGFERLMVWFEVVEELICLSDRLGFEWKLDYRKRNFMVEYKLLKYESGVVCKDEYWILGKVLYYMSYKENNLWIWILGWTLRTWEVYIKCID